MNPPTVKLAIHIDATETPSTAEIRLTSSDGQASEIEWTQALRDLADKAAVGLLGGRILVNHDQPAVRRYRGAHDPSWQVVQVMR